jgi:hypothetical protein
MLEILNYLVCPLYRVEDNLEGILPENSAYGI